MQRWHWLAPIPDFGQRRNGLRGLWAASGSVVLAFLALPMLGLLAVLFGLLPALLLFLYVKLTGAHMLPRQQENLSMMAAFVLIVIGWCLLYCGLQGYALRRFTRQWHRPLFFGMVACTCIPFPVAMYVAQKVSWSHTSTIPLQPIEPIIEQWIFAIFVVSQMGALFGKWLASPSPNQGPEKVTISL